MSDGSVRCRTSTASVGRRCSLPHLKPPAPDGCVPHRTSTTSFSARWQCSPPDLRTSTASSRRLGSPPDLNRQLPTDLDRQLPTAAFCAGPPPWPPSTEQSATRAVSTTHGLYCVALGLTNPTHKHRQAIYATAATCFLTADSPSCFELFSSPLAASCRPSPLRPRSAEALRPLPPYIYFVHSFLNIPQDTTTTHNHSTQPQHTTTNIAANTTTKDNRKHTTTKLQRNQIYNHKHTARNATTNTQSQT